MGKSLIAFLIVLLSGGTPRTSEEPESRRQFQALVERYETGRRDFVAAIRKAGSDDERKKIVAELRPDEAKFIARFYELAERAPSSPVAAESANWILTHQPYDPDPRAVAIVAKYHVESDAIGDLCQAIWASSRAENGGLLRRIAERNPNRQVRASATLGIAYFLLYNGNRPDPGDKAPETARALAMQAEAVTYLRRASEQYPDVMIGNAAVGETARASLVDIQKFGIGQRVMELEGVDAEGKGFKLSDYRGKVVVLTFSGNWCSPCKAMYPAQRALVERYKDRPFAILSVSTDEKVDTLRQSIREGEITWRCWWDGGLDGPICRAWDVRKYPTIYVIDAAGVIRYRDVQGDLTMAVDLLMREPSK